MSKHRPVSAFERAAFHHRGSAGALSFNAMPMLANVQAIAPAIEASWAPMTTPVAAAAPSIRVDRLPSGLYWVSSGFDSGPRAKGFRVVSPDADAWDIACANYHYLWTKFGGGNTTSVIVEGEKEAPGMPLASWSGFIVYPKIAGAREPSITGF
jgi:hypothetical protein